MISLRYGKKFSHIIDYCFISSSTIAWTDRILLLLVKKTMRQIYAF